MTRQFMAYYGEGHLADRMQAVGDLMALNVREPRWYTLTFIRNSWGTLNRRWIQEIKAITNAPRLHARVERPTYSQLKSIGMTIGPITNETIFQRPDVFPIRNVNGYYQSELPGK